MKFRAKGRRLLLFVGVAVFAALFGSVASVGILRNQRQELQPDSPAEPNFTPSVSVAAPHRGTGEAEVAFQGELRAWHETPIYARATGYVKNWHFDYGAHVKAGEVLAEIDVPAHEEALAAAQAKLGAAQADVSLRQAELKFANSSYERWRDAPKGAVSAQSTMAKKDELESATARLNAAVANAKLAQDELDLAQAHSTEGKLTAPFDGVVTERNVDIGVLVKSGTEVRGETPTVLFRIADTHKMRIFMNVPQETTTEIKEGLSAQLRLPQFPGKVFDAIIVTTSQAIDLSSQELLVELTTDNSAELLLPGSHAQVQFNLPINPESLYVPAGALLFRHQDTEVAVVGPDNKIKLTKVTVGRKVGTQIEILNGIEPSALVVNSQPESLATGDLVHIAAHTRAGAR